MTEDSCLLLKVIEKGLEMIPNIVQFGFGILVVFVLLSYAFIFQRVRAYMFYRRFLLLWLFITGYLGMKKFFEDFSSMPPRVPLFILMFLVSLAVFFNFILKEQGLAKVQQKFLVLFQVFRLPVEVLLAMLAREALLPKELSLEGRNFDIITGITALFVFFYVHKKGEEQSRKVLIAWNAMGVVLLSGVVIQGIFSTPYPFQIFAFEPANFIMGSFPVTWLPLFLVPTAYFFHFVSLYKVLKKGAKNH